MQLLSVLFLFLISCWDPILNSVYFSSILFKWLIQLFKVCTLISLMLFLMQSLVLMSIKRSFFFRFSIDYILWYITFFWQTYISIASVSIAIWSRQPQFLRCIFIFCNINCICLHSIVVCFFFFLSLYDIQSTTMRKRFFFNWKHRWFMEQLQ